MWPNRSASRQGPSMSPRVACLPGSRKKSIRYSTRRTDEMKTTTACPPTEDLRQLLDGSLSGERQQECMDHLEDCQSCQARLEDLATGGTILSRVVQRVHESEPGATSA